MARLSHYLETWFLGRVIIRELSFFMLGTGVENFFALVCWDTKSICQFMMGYQNFE